MRFVAIFAVLASAVYLCSQPVPRQQPGPQPDGSTLLSNGWRIKPAGRQVPLGTFPMSTALSPDGKFLLILNGGYMPPYISVHETATMKEVGRAPVQDAWLGMTFSPDGKLVYVSGGSRACVYEFSFSTDGQMTARRTFSILPEGQQPQWTDFVGDVAITPNGRLLYAAALYQNAIHVINPQSGRAIEKFQTGRRPYRILFHPDGQSFFVSSWADATLYQHKTETGEQTHALRLGPHPTDIVWRKRKGSDEAEGQYEGRLFVSAANTNSVYVVAVAENKDLRQIETINVGLTARHPLGMTPSALALSPDEDRLYIVCSDANAVAIADLTEARSHVLGFVPTAWYPTAARVLADNRLVVLNGRGLRSYPNPGGPNPTKRTAPVHQGGTNIEYVARIQTGTASVLDPITEEQLDAYTQTVQQMSPYRDEFLDRIETGPGNPVPSSPGDPSPIQHVIYVVKENRSYDQVLGDIGRGNSDPSLTLFGENITPNQHKIAREFVLFDNFYVNADVSADGHNWSTSAIANDYVQKMWPNSYSARRKHYDYEGGEAAALPPAGYLWTNAAAKGVTMRNYGYWATNVPNPAEGAPQIANVRDPILARVTNSYYRAFDLNYFDVDRIKVFLKDLAEFQTSGNMPKLIFLRLGNDHTNGTAAGRLAPLSLAADNDHAVGMLVEAMSRSKFWASTAIFILEDDAQNGPDHVDSHRSTAYIISPYTHRGTVDSNMYNTTSMLRTIELILGLRPMTHFDAGSKPMSTAFANTADVKPFTAEQPRVSTTDRNAPANPTSARSLQMDFSDADRADDDELNDILWLAIRKTEPPAPVRSYFSRR